MVALPKPAMDGVDMGWDAIKFFTKVYVVVWIVNEAFGFLYWLSQ